MYDPKYKMRHKQTQSWRQRYRRPLPMVGDPPVFPPWDWARRARLIYQIAMDQKRGIVRDTQSVKRGLWFRT
jgi:hypothetical protein